MAQTALFVSIFSTRWGRREELGLGYVAAAIAARGYRVKMVAVSEEPSELDDELVRTLATEHPRLVGIACSHVATSLDVLVRISALIRSVVPFAHITAGGYHATFNHQHLLEAWSDLDSVVLGEGETTCAELVEAICSGGPIEAVAGLALRGGKLRLRDPVTDLDTLPPPIRTLGGGGRGQIASVATSRGCMAHCTFCNVPNWTRHFGRGWRGRTPDRVVDEIAQLRMDHGIRRFWIVDSSFEDPVPEGFERMAAFARIMGERLSDVAYYIFMRAESVATDTFRSLLPLLVGSGLRRIFVGVETGSVERLRRLGKRAKIEDAQRAAAVIDEAGLALRAGMIMFTPDGTLDDLRRNCEFMVELDTIASTADLCTSMELYTGSAEVPRLARLGLLTGDCWNNPYSYRFGDSRLQRPATLLREIRQDPTHEYFWESLHTARLVGRGALLTPAVQAQPRLKSAASRYNRDVNEIWSFMGQANQEFVHRLIALIETGWDEEEFASMRAEHLVGYQTECGRTAATLARAFLLEADAAGVNVVY